MRRLVLGLGFIVALAFVISACTPIEPSGPPGTLAPGRHRRTDGQLPRAEP